MMAMTTSNSISVNPATTGTKMHTYLLDDRMRINKPVDESAQGEMCALRQLSRCGRDPASAQATTAIEALARGIAQETRGTGYRGG